MKPKPLVQVWRDEPGRWEYECARCLRQGWGRTWRAIYARARDHAGTHVGVGFSLPK